MSARIDPRTITDAERPFLAELDSFEAMARLQRRIIGAGHSWAMASGTCTHLMALKADDPELLPSGPQRANYRRILRELLEQDRPKGRRRRAAEAGRAELAPVIGMTAGAMAGAVAFAASGPAAATIGVPVALYVTRNPGDVAELELATATEPEELATVVRMRCATDDDPTARVVRKAA